MFQTYIVGKLKHTFYVQYIFPRNCAVYDVMWKNTVEWTGQ